jgi:hypothetical protein
VRVYHALGDRDSLVAFSLSQQGINPDTLPGGLPALSPVEIQMRDLAAQVEQAKKDAQTAHAAQVAAEGEYTRGKLPWFVYRKPESAFGSAPYVKGQWFTAEPWFNIGGNSEFTYAAAKFFNDSPEWRDYLSRLKLDPGAEYLTALMQDNREGKSGKEYVTALYIRQGEFWKPLGFYETFVSSGWVRFRDNALIPIGMVALAVLSGGIAASIGGAVLGPSLAAAYPGLASAIGNVALSTALSGGDLESAVKGAAFGFLGSVAGGAAKAATGLDAIGVATGAATSAALRGGNLGEAVAQSLLMYGAKNVDFDFFASDSPDVAMDFQATAPVASWETTDWAAPVPAVDFTTDRADWATDWGAVFSPPASWQGTDWSAPKDPLSDFTTDKADWQTDWNVVTGGFDPAGFDPAKAVAAPAPAAPGGSGWVADLTALALAAIKVNSAYQASKAPQPRTVTQSPGTTRTGNANGTVTVTNTATGARTVTRPEVGVPYVLPDGRSIINNGDGSYSTINPDGTTVRNVYAATPSGAGGVSEFLSSVPPVAWIALAGLVALPLLTRRQR